jgi:signal transduction histidine kinase
MELAGVLLENATQWAREKIRIHCVRHAAIVELTVEDDGVGIGDDQIAKLGVRGTRLDESTSGEGIGLAIAYEIVRLNRGTITAGRGAMGGLVLVVRVPAG